MNRDRADITRERLLQGYSEARSHLLFVPGRIEVLGKHTDYAGGRSLVAATEQGMLLAVSTRADSLLTLDDLSGGQRAEIDLESPGVPSENWLRYPLAVVRRLSAAFPPLRTGADIRFVNSLPRAAGMSSSSVLVVAIHLALALVNRLDARQGYRALLGDPTDLASYLGAVENGYPWKDLPTTGGVGTLGGSEDPTAILCSARGELRQYRYLPTRLERRLPLPEEMVFAVAASGVTAAKTGNAKALYNRASGLTIAATRTWNEVSGRSDPHLSAALAANGGDATQLIRAIADAEPTQFPIRDLIERVEHFCDESEVFLPAASAALERGDLDAFGKWVDRSQQAAETSLHNQIPETAFLARSARELGAAAASAFGAGFGGSVWALVGKGSLEPFMAGWSDSFEREFPEAATRARFFSTGAAAGARNIDPSEISEVLDHAS